MSSKGNSVSGSSGLPRGRHNLTRERVVRSQRDRLFTAMAQACAAEGYGATTVASVTARAGVSRKTFYEQFGDKEACFLASYDAILGRFIRAVIGAYEARELQWPERVRAGVERVLELLAADPEWARMCFVDVLVAGPPALERYESAIRLIATLIDEGRGETRAHNEPPPGTAVAIVSGCAVLIRDRILAEDTDRLTELAADILYATLSPYLGQADALRYSV